MRIAILGAGAWGTALAVHAAAIKPAGPESGAARQVVLWTRDPGHAARMTAERTNARYLPGVALDARITVTADLATALAAADLWVVATSVGGLRPVLRRMLAAAPEPLRCPLLWLCKGLEADTALLPGEVIEQEWPGLHSGALSGPSFAQEVAAGLPVALTVASLWPAVARSAVAAFHHGAARIYHTDDVVGVAVAGALKNIMAVATGIADGLGLGLNARAALLTRGLAEVCRYGAALGARSETFMGLAGVGDLVLTCTGDLSRNRRVGLRLARGETLAAILADLGHVAEGVACCSAVQRRNASLGVDLPIISAVAEVLFAARPPHEAVAELLAREPKAEFVARVSGSDGSGV